MILYYKPKGVFIVAFAFIAAIGCTSNKAKITATEKTTDSIWLLPFIKLDSANPVMQPGSSTFNCPVQKRIVQWEAKNIYNPAVAVKNDTLFMLYRAQDSAGCSRIGLAKSTDGIHFTRYTAPVLYPDNDAYKKYEW